ncbi:hypothetical protein [Psychrobacter celer]|uniref:hypothetical protein n=1 Tax=Psychrobacter celer TaxID=306572 RepID=UPI003FCFC658
MNTAVGIMQTEQVGRIKKTFVGKSYSITVGDEFKITVGKSSLVMNADGSIIITGSSIITQAEGENKVIGKDVLINPPGAVGGHAPPRHERLPNQNGGQNTKVPFLNASKPRPPTAGEKAMIKKVFGDSVDVNKVGIRKAEMLNDRSAVINGDIYFDDKYYVEDFSKTQNPLSANYNPESGALFVHEMTHVWAGQKGHQNVANGAYLQGQYELYRKTKGQYGFDPYKYSINPNKNFGDYNMEQQGEIIADYYVMTNDYPDKDYTGLSDTAEKLFKKKKNFSEVKLIYEDVLSEFHKDPNNVKNLPSWR